MDQAAFAQDRDKTLVIAAPATPLSLDVENSLSPATIDTVAAFFGTSADAMAFRSRRHDVLHPRQIAMYLCKQHTTRSYPDIGRHFGGRDHTTVLHGVRKIDSLLATDEQIARDVEALTRKLRG
mgnify:CR=1 FL=1